MPRYYIKCDDKLIAWLPSEEQAKDFVGVLRNFHPIFKDAKFEIVMLVAQFPPIKP